MSTPEFVSVEFAHDRLELAVPTTPEGLTVVGVTAWPDGRRDVTIGIYKMPVGSAWNQTWRNFTVAALARASALAAPLFRADAFSPSLSDDVLSEIAMGKWLDPVLGALAFHAHDRAYAARLARAQHGTPPPPWEMQEIRENMSRHFPWLPDSCIIAACHLDPDERRRALIALLDDPALRQPVLTASLAHLARAALVADRTDHWALDRYERIAPGQVFNVVRSS
jgi:hypothetical protein